MSVLHLELGDQKAKKITRLLTNDTAQRVMDAISEDSKSESEIAKELSIPLSTVHYNVQRLVDAGLVTSEEYTYSEKGKEVRHYKLASEHVVITTTSVATLPAALTGLGLSLAVAITVFFAHANTAPQRSAAMDGAQEAAIAAAPAVQQTPSLWPYVLLGAAAMLVGVLIAYAVRRVRG